MARPLKLNWNVETFTFSRRDKKTEAVAIIGANTNRPLRLAVTRYAREDYIIRLNDSYVPCTTEGTCRLRTAMIEAEDFVEKLLLDCIKDFKDV